MLSPWHPMGSSHGNSGDSGSLAATTALQYLVQLTDSASRSASLDDLYSSAVEAVRDGLESVCARLFLRDAASGDFLSAASAPRDPRPRPVVPPLRLKNDAFAVRRLRRHAAPWSLDPADFDAWEHGIEKSFPEHLSTRREEIQTLQIARARLLVPILHRGEMVGFLVLGPREHGAGYSAAARESSAALAAQFALLLASR